MSSPIVAVDHLRVASADVRADCANYRALLGFEPILDGEIEGRPTAIFRTGNVHLVLASPAGGESGLCEICFRIDDRERLRRRLARLGLVLARDAAVDPLAALGEGAATGYLDVLDAGAARGLAVSFVSRRESPAAPVSPRVQGLDHVVIASAGATGTGFFLGAQLGLDLRMDITREDWNGRLMFFRCGDVIVEVFQPLDGAAAADTGHDRFHGLSWRVDDADLAHDALVARGLNVSEVRVGRKPGTRVLTVRDGTAGVATLLLEPAAAGRRA